MSEERGRRPSLEPKSPASVCDDLGSRSRARKQRPFVQSLRHALDGWYTGVVEERNMRIHTLFSVCMLLFELVTRPPMGVVALSCMTIATVMGMELINTAFERVADFVVHGETHEFAKIVKDTAAGAVLVASLGSLSVAAYVVYEAFPWHWALFSSRHVGGAVMTLCALLVLLGVSVRCLGRQKGK